MITASEFIGIHTALRRIVESELGIEVPVPEAVREMVERFGGAFAADANSGAVAGGAAAQPVPPLALAWLALLDLGVGPHLLRLHMKRLGAEENVIRAILRFYVDRPRHSEIDRDKVDWLATYLFRAREERTNVPTGWPKAEVQDILQGFDFPPLSGEAAGLLAELCALLEDVRYFEKFVQITDSRVIQRGRDLKNRFGQEFFHPEVLVAIINYNLVFGKKFHALLQQTVDDVREFVSELGTGPRDAHELVHTDYRSTSDAFRDLGELDRKRQSETRAAAPGGSPDSSSRWQRLKELGVNVQKEADAVKLRREEIAVRFKANPSLGAIPGNFGSLQLSEWEEAAFRTSYPESEKSFRVDFAVGITHAIAILSSADDELHAYDQKKGTEFLWKKHYDALLFLLQEGREHVGRITLLAEATEKKGLSEKARQLKQSAEKLGNRLAAVAAVFSR